MGNVYSTIFWTFLITPYVGITHLFFTQNGQYHVKSKSESFTGCKLINIELST